MKKGKGGIAYKSGKLLCAIAIALLIFSFSPFTFLPVSADADVSRQSGKWSDYYYFLSPHFSNEVVFNIINAQSYPSVGGNWAVCFNTTGQADLALTITPVDNKQIELVEKRTRNSKTYSLGNGKYVWEGSIGDIHYQDENNTWQEINLTITESNNDEYGYDYKNTENNFQSFFKKSSTADNTVKYQEKDSSIFITFTLEDNELGKLNTVEGYPDNNQFVYPNAYDNTDVKYSISTRELLEEFVLYQPMDVTRITQRIHFENAYFKFKEVNGSIIFYSNKTNDPIWEIPRPKMYELNEREFEFENYGLHYELKREGEDYLITKVLDEEGIKWLSSPDRVYPVVIDATTVDKQVAASTDDAQEDGTGWVELTENTLWLDNATYWGGFRFTNVDIPQGATIDVSTMDIYKPNWAMTVSHNIHCEDVDDAATFAGGDANLHDISSRTRTTAYTNWNEALPDAAGWHTSPSLVGPVQEVINRPGWSSGNDIAFIWDGVTGVSDFAVTSYDGSTTNAAKLHIEYTIPSAPVVEKPKTYDSSGVEETTFEAGEDVTVRVNVTDADGAPDIDKVLVNITSPAEQKVTNAEITNKTSITNGYTYEYNYSLTDLTQSDFGTWQVDITANDTAGATDTNSTTFNVPDTTPPALDFLPPTPANNSYQTENFAEINISLNEKNLNTFKFNWNGTNYTFYDDSLVLGMNFNNNSAIGESATKAVDISKYGNDGTAYNGAHPVTGGKFGGAFEFDGNNDYVRVPDSTSLDISPNITIEMWIKPDLLSGTQVLIWKYHAYGMEIWNDGSFGGYIWKPGSDSRVTVESSENKTTTDAWYHLAFTYDKTAGKMSLYLNGTSAGSVSYSGDIRTSTDPLYIGSTDTPDYWFDGAIDEVKIYNRALSSEEIKMHYQSEFQKYNQTQWYFYDNVTNIPEGTHTYYGWANDTAGNAGQTETRTLTRDVTTPTWQNQGSNTTKPLAGASDLLYAQGKDETALDYAVLSTNESGAWENITEMDMGDATGWTWSNFTWQNSSITAGTTVGWRIWYNDTAGNLNVTDVMCFTVQAGDTTPPASITNLQNTTGNFWINWTWTNPADADFNHTMVYIDGTFVENVSKSTPYYNATYTAHATKTISTHTVDTAGNVNSTWVNQTTTIPNNVPELESIGDKTVDEGTELNLTIIASDLDGDTLTFSDNKTSFGEFTTINSTAAYWSWTPDYDDAGVHYVDFGVSDGKGGTDNETVKITVSDVTAPVPSNISYNNTYAGLPTSLSVYWTDATGLSGYIFATNNTAGGDLVNESWVPMTGTANWSNVTITLNKTIGLTIGWRIYANDTTGNWNDTGIQTIITTSAPPSNISVSVSPTEVAANGINYATITLQAIDDTWNAVSNNSWINISVNSSTAKFSTSGENTTSIQLNSTGGYSILLTE